jgi:hypothetical protein
LSAAHSRKLWLRRLKIAVRFLFKILIHNADYGRSKK